MYLTFMEWKFSLTLKWNVLVAQISNLAVASGAKIESWATEKSNKVNLEYGEKYVFDWVEYGEN